MAIRKIKPTTPGQRGMTVSAYDEITCTTPERSLLEDLKSSAAAITMAVSPFVIAAAAQSASTA